MVGLADVGDASDLEVHDTGTDKGGHNSCGEELEYSPESTGSILTCYRLAPERLALGNLEIVAKLEIIRKVKSVSDSDISETFEKVHLETISPAAVLAPKITYRQGIARLPCASDELGKDIVLDFDTSSSEDDTGRNGE